MLSCKMCDTLIIGKQKTRQGTANLQYRAQKTMSHLTATEGAIPNKEIQTLIDTLIAMGMNPIVNLTEDLSKASRDSKLESYYTECNLDSKVTKANVRLKYEDICQALGITPDKSDDRKWADIGWQFGENGNLEQIGDTYSYVRSNIDGQVVSFEIDGRTIKLTLDQAIKIGYAKTFAENHGGQCRINTDGRLTVRNPAIKGKQQSRLSGKSTQQNRLGARL